MESIETIDTKIEYLTLDELKLLANTSCSIPVLKSAALFSCLTGLRISDVLKLDWSEIVEASDGGYCMRLRTEKTETETTLPLSNEAIELLGDRATGKVFSRLARSMTAQPLKNWIKTNSLIRNKNSPI